MYTGLSASNLRDRPTRAQTMLEKIEKNEDFYLKDGTTIKIDADKSAEFVLGLHELLRTGRQERLSAASTLSHGTYSPAAKATHMCK